MGFSFEFNGIRAYTGDEAAAVNPVLVRLIRDLNPGQTPLLRIGGDSTDQTWWPTRGVSRPASVSYGLTHAWLRTTGAFARASGARMILGVNLAMNRPRLAAAEARALIGGIGRRVVSAIEIGNEADVYGRFPRYRRANGQLAHVRRSSYSLAGFLRDFSRVSGFLPGVPTAGPTFGSLTWMAGLSRFLDAQPHLSIVTFHRYPLSCFARAGRTNYPSIVNLLSDNASRGLADGVARYVAIAHARRLHFRLDELNSVTCGGRRGVSDTFASALWVLDTLFEMARVGVDGVNLHTLPHAAYEPFSFTHTAHGWQAVVHPSYYGLRMFARAAPPGSRLLRSTNRIGSALKVWATMDAARRIRYVLINKGSSRRSTVLWISGSSNTATVQRLLAPSIAATSGVTLGGQSFAEPTRTGLLTGAFSTTTLHRTRAGAYVISLPPRSAALVTS